MNVVGIFVQPGTKPGNDFQNQQEIPNHFKSLIWVRFVLQSHMMLVTIFVVSAFVGTFLKYHAWRYLL